MGHAMRPRKRKGKLMLTFFGVCAVAFILIALAFMYLDGYWSHEEKIKRAQFRAYNRLLNGKPRLHDVDAARQMMRNRRY
jgi:hypothetical protein